MKKQLLIVSVVPLLTGCGIYTNYQKAEEVPMNLYGEEVLIDTTTVGLGDLGWRSLFTDPQLQALIERGLQNNTDLQSARLRVEQAEAAMLSAKLAYLPSFALVPQGTISSFDKHEAVETYSLPLTASWQLDFFGGIRNAKKQAKALLEQSRDYEQAVQTQLIAGIANTYYTLQMLDAQLSICEQTEHSWGESVKSTRALMNAGMANEAAVSQMEAAHLSVQTSVCDLKEQINQVENSLSLLLADTPQHIQRTSWTEVTFACPESLSIGLPIQLLANRPDVRAAERNLEAAFYSTNMARSAFYPSVSFSGSAGWTNSAGGVIINPGKFLASAVGSLTQPFFAQGRLVGQLKIAKAQQEQASLAFQQALLNAGAEVNEAMVACETSRAKSDLLDRQVASLEKVYHSTSLLMLHGTTTYLEVLTAQQSLLSAQLQQTANRFKEIQCVINLYSALGGGKN